MTEEPGEEPKEPVRALTFDEARDRLRSKGYLDRGVEGAVLMGALAARNRVRAIVQGAAVAALFLAGALALVSTSLAASASWLSPRDAAVLFLWLFVGALMAASALVLLLVALASLRVRSSPETASTEISVVFGLVVGLLGALAAAPALDPDQPWGAVAILAAVAVAVVVAVRTARGVAFAMVVASGRAVLARRKGAGLLAVSLALLSVGALVVLRPEVARDEPLVVEASGRRAVVIGIDGWSDRYLPEGTFQLATGLTYRKDGRDPAAFWTTVATGEPAARHGIGSLDLVRVAGVSAPFRPLAGSAWYLGRVLPALGVARRESVTAAARRVPAVWEVARRAGIASLVVGWWTTYPAGDAGGTVLSNHLFFAARGGAALVGEGWPADAAVRAARLAPKAVGAPGSLARLIGDAEGLDAFAIAAFRDAFEREKPRLSLLYLPGLDILAAALQDPARDAADRVALAGALTREAERLSRFVGQEVPALGADLSVVVLDGGRHADAGVVSWSGPLARGGSGELRIVDLAPTLLASLGVPASRGLAGHVRADLVTTATKATVASWGRRRQQRDIPVDAKEYVENLRSLGYLK